MSTPGRYDNHVERLLSGSTAGQGGALDHATADIRATLIDDTDYTADFAVDVDYANADVPDIAKVSQLAAGLGSKTITNGVFDAADDTFSAVSGDGVDSTLLNDHDAIDANAELMVLLDNGGSTTPNGNDINIQWDAGASRIYRLN